MPEKGKKPRIVNVEIAGEEFPRHRRAKSPVFGPGQNKKGCRQKLAHIECRPPKKALTFAVDKR